MNPIAMAAAMVLAFAVFTFSIRSRWRLLKVAAPEDRFGHLGERLKNAVDIALFQKKLPKYKFMGPVHMVIFWGFLVLLINTLILWGRGFDEGFNLWILGDNPLGHAYHFVKDIVTAAVFVAAVLALFHRVVLRPKRLTKSGEAVLILMIIAVMMVADVLYWGSELVRSGVSPEGGNEPVAALAAGVLGGMGQETVSTLGAVGFWTHSLLVLLFLNLLPHGKHFHVITSIPNVFFSNLGPVGRLPKDDNIEKELLEDDDDEDWDDDDDEDDAEEKDDDEGDDDEDVYGVAEIQHFTWKDVLDMYSCTECGRCTDNCPAAKTGKPLSPKKLLIDLRDHLYARKDEILSGKMESKALVPDVIPAEVIWSCTTCRACEEECPVMNTFVEKIVKIRRDLVEGRGEPPTELATALRGMETNQNPWNLSAMDRGDWAEGLEIQEFDSDECDYLLFVGCMASFDDRAKKISRAVVKLLDEAGVSYGYMGSDEPCCGETARRAGSESNARTMIDENIETFKALGVKKIITACPHCFNTFKNEYPEFGGSYEVIHHSELLAELVGSGKITPKERIDQKVTLHDPCYLGRYNGVFDAPRRVLNRIPGLVLSDVPTCKERALCCGAGGGRFFMEEEGERVGNRRVEELLTAEPKTLASACPYCMTMLSDGLKAKDLFDDKGQLDIAELLAISCGLEPRKLLREGESS